MPKCIGLCDNRKCADEALSLAEQCIKEEREACAKLCEQQITGGDYHYLATHTGHWDHMAQMATNCADAIRMRSDRKAKGRRMSAANEASTLSAGLDAIAEDLKLLEIGRQAIEDMLIEWRDSRLSEFSRGNGLVIREKDGKESSIIRFGPETALYVGIKAIAKHLASNAEITRR